MKESSQQFGKSKLTPRQAKDLDDALLPSRFDFFVHRVLGRANFWDKQAVMQASLLLGNVALVTAGGIVATKGHGNVGEVMIGGVLALNLAAAFTSKKMAKREGLKEILTGHKEGAPQRASSRTFVGGMLATVIAIAAIHAAPLLSERAYKALYGHAPTQIEMQRHAEFFKDIK